MYRNFANKDVKIRNTDMSFSYYDKNDGFNYAGTGISGYFAQKKNFFSPKHYRFLLNVKKYSKKAANDVSSNSLLDETLGEYLIRNEFPKDIIDKFMIPQKEAISQTAFYAVAVFIATVVEIPGRAMFQIINPLVAKSLNQNNIGELKNLYTKSSINLLIVAGLFFLLININIEPFYEFMANPSYGDAIWVVMMISLSKLILMSFGCGPAILATAKFYKIF